MRLALAAGLGLSGLGCEASESVLQVWWGPIQDSNNELRFDNGGSFTVTGLANQIDVEGDDDDSAGDSGSPDRRLLEVVLVGGEAPITCSVYADYLQAVQDQQDYIAAVMQADEADRPVAEEWRSYVCQSLEGAALHAFQGEGRYRAAHMLLDISGDSGPEGGLFRPADRGEPETGSYGGAEALVPSTYVSRIYERGRHGGGILPQGGDGPWVAEDIDPVQSCSPILDALMEEISEGRTDYPDRASVALQSSNHRYYHLSTGEEVVSLEGSSNLDLGVTIPGWAQAGKEGGEVQVTFFGQVTRAPSIFPYTQVLVSSLGSPIPLEVCPELGTTFSLVWPELTAATGSTAAR